MSLFSKELSKDPYAKGYKNNGYAMIRDWHSQYDIELTWDEQVDVFMRCLYEHTVDPFWEVKCPYSEGNN